MYTREGFERLRITSAREMASDRALREQALDVLVNADRYHWLHQGTWFGEPVLQLAQDMFALQEIVFKTRPKYVVEVGVAWGGSLLFCSTLMQVLGGSKVIGIDVFIPDDLRQRLAGFGAISDKIALINGSSIQGSTIEQVKSIIGNCSDVLVILDSNHTCEHVLKELQLYSQLVGPGHYLICADTIIQDLPDPAHRPRPWGRGNNPRTALDRFLKDDDRFEVDTVIESKLLFTLNPGGYLRCREDCV